MAAAMSASSGARSAIHAESLASALARGAPRTSTHTGGTGSGGSGATWHATDPTSSCCCCCPSGSLQSPSRPRQLTSIVSLSSPSSPWASRYCLLAAATVASSRGFSRSGRARPSSNDGEASASLSIAATDAAVRSTCVFHSKMRVPRLHVRAVV